MSARVYAFPRGLAKVPRATPPGPTAHLAATWRQRAEEHRRQAERCDQMANEFDHPCPPPRANEETGSPACTEGDPREQP
jgi:hypothetical protein